MCAIYNRFSLAIYFIHSIKSVYMWILISQFIPPPSSWYSNICSLYLRLYFCFVDKILYTNFFQILHTCINIRYLFFPLTFFTLYNNLRSIQVSTNDPVSFLFMAEQYSIICICTTSSSSILLLMAIQVVSMSRLLEIVLQ